MAEVELIDLATVVGVEAGHKPRRRSTEVERAAKLAEIDLVDDAVAVRVSEQPEEVRLARAAAEGIVRAVVIAPGRARTRPVQFHGPGAEHVSCENGQPVFAVHKRCVAAVRRALWIRVRPGKCEDRLGPPRASVVMFVIKPTAVPSMTRCNRNACPANEFDPRNVT